MKEIIIRNSARCLHCGDEIESTHRHDFRSCRCGNLNVDGGQEYLRRVYKPGSRWEDTSITEMKGVGE
jgi:tRNA(Ile2) C34 agmatinyltransferase TiaS